MAKKNEFPEEAKILAQLSLDKSAEVVASINAHFDGRLKMDENERAIIAKAIFEALDAAFTRLAKD